MIAIGIDPSVTHTGIVVLDSDRYVCESRAIKTKPVDTWQEQAFRIQTITDTVRDLVTEWSGEGSVVFMEDYAIGGGFPGTIIPQVELGGQLRLFLAGHSHRPRRSVYFVAPTALKKFATGKGNANKVEVATSLMKRFGVDFGGDHDLFDAYALARMAAVVANNDYTSLTLDQVRVATNVVQPKVKKTRKGTQ